jgi:hypothetical protein
MIEAMHDLILEQPSPAFIGESQQTSGFAKGQEFEREEILKIVEAHVRMIETHSHVNITSTILDTIIEEIRQRWP